MVHVLQVISVILVVLAMVPALAHALELPGKLRLPKDTYIAVQAIYYPGFTIAGISEPVAIISTLALCVVTPQQSADFWLTLAGLLGLILMHAVYWFFTHPVNNFWVAGQKLSGLGSRFFSVGAASARNDVAFGWAHLRNRWEYSHVVRAGLAFFSFIILLIAASSPSG